MSRYEFMPEGWPASYSLAIGWDKPLATYFVQVMDRSIGQDDNSVIIWLGGWPPHYRDLDVMMRTLNSELGGTLPGIALTRQMRAMLAKDRKRGTPVERRERRSKAKAKPIFALDLFPPGNDVTEA